MTRCSKCGETLEIGDFPFCPHQSVHRQPAQVLLSVVFRDPSTGEYHVPGSSGDPTPRGLERVEIRDSRHWNRVEGEMNQRTRAEAQRVFEQDRVGFGEVRREMHSDLRSMARDFTPQGRELADYALEKAREKDRGRKPKDAPGYFAGRHFTEGHLRAETEQRMHEALRRKK